jgi:hypothetical protein
MKRYDEPGGALPVIQMMADAGAPYARTSPGFNPKDEFPPLLPGGKIQVTAAGVFRFSGKISRDISLLAIPNCGVRVEAREHNALAG